MQKNLIGLLIIIFGILTSSCNYFNDPDDELILNVDNEFEISMKEVLGSDVRGVEFTIVSLTKQECQETILELKKKTTLNSLNIEIADILFPDICGAKGSYPIGSASFNIAERLYQLEVNIQDIVNHKGTLEVTNNAYMLGFQNTNGLIPTTDFLHRIPNNFVWGYYQAQKSIEIEKLESFFTSNYFTIGPLRHLQNGYYSYFSIDKEGQISIENIPTLGTVVQFGFENMEISNIKDKVSRFKTLNPGLTFKFYASDGSEF